MTSNIVIYKSGQGEILLEVNLKDETIWLNQAQISELFQTERSVITKHLKNIFNTGELDEKSVCANFAHTARDGKTYQTKYYNIDAIVSLGYRVNSRIATQFQRTPH